MGYTFTPERGSVNDRPDTPPPSTLRALYDNSVSLWQAGFRSGMSDARRSNDQQAYETHAKLSRGLYGQSPISRAFSDGYVAGHASITSGAMQ